MSREIPTQGFVFWPVGYSTPPNFVPVPPFSKG